VGAADANLERHAILSHESLRYVDAEIGKRSEQVRVVPPHRIATVMVFIPGLIVIPCPVTKSGHDPRQIVGVFSIHVLLHDLQPSADAVTHDSHSSLQYN
jgi:hypothetical protein